MRLDAIYTKSMAKDKKGGLYYRNRGHRYERDVVRRLRDVGYTRACSSRSESHSLDAMNVDVCYTDPILVQCKSTNKCVNYVEVLSSMPNKKDGRINVVFNKIEGAKSDYVILEASDFLEIISVLIKERIIKV